MAIWYFGFHMNIAFIFLILGLFAPHCPFLSEFAVTGAIQNRYLTIKARFDPITGEVVSIFFHHAIPSMIAIGPHADPHETPVPGRPGQGGCRQAPGSDKPDPRLKTAGLHYRVHHAGG